MESSEHDPPEHAFPPNIISPPSVVSSRVWSSSERWSSFEHDLSPSVVPIREKSPPSFVSSERGLPEDSILSSMISLSAGVKELIGREPNDVFDPQNRLKES